MAAGVIVVALAGAIALAGCSALQTAAAHTAMAAPAARARASGAADGVGERVFTFIDHSRLVRIPGQGLQPRKLVTVVRYPLHASRPGRADRLRTRLRRDAGVLLPAARGVGAGRIRRRGARLPAWQSARTRRPGRGGHRQPATRHELRHFANAGGQRTAPGSARRADRSEQDRGQRAVRRRRDRARGRIRQRLPGPTGARRDHPVRRRRARRYLLRGPAARRCSPHRGPPTTSISLAMPTRSSRLRGDQSSCSS